MNYVGKMSPQVAFLFSRMTGMRARLMLLIALVQLMGLAGFIVQEVYVSFWFHRELIPYIQQQLLITFLIVLDDLVVLCLSFYKWTWTPLLLGYRLPDYFNEGVEIIRTSWNETIPSFQAAKFIAVIDPCLVPLILLSIGLMILDVIHWGRLRLRETRKDARF